MEGVHVAEDALHAAVRGAVEPVPVDVDVVGEHFPRLALGVPFEVHHQVAQERGQREHGPQVVAPEGIDRTALVVVAEQSDQLRPGRQRSPIVLLVQVVDLADRGGPLRDPLADFEQCRVVGDDADAAEILLAAPVGLGKVDIESLARRVRRPLHLAHQQVVQRTGDQIAARRIEEPGGDVVVVDAFVDHDGAFDLLLVRTRA